MLEASLMTEERPAWVRAHGEVLDVARERAGLESREGQCLLRAFREQTHRHLGHGAFAEYTDRYLGYGHRATQDKLRVAEALERLPQLARAQRDGRLHATAVRELARVATPDTEAEWIEAAAGRRVREIERLVAGRARGDVPSDTPHPELERHILRFEVSGETLAAFRQAIHLLREHTGGALDDDTALLMLARRVLCAAPVPNDVARTNVANDITPEAVAPTATGRAKYQITLMECERCQRAFQRAGADLVEIDRAMLEAARCDASTSEAHTSDACTHAHVGRQDKPRSRATASISPALRRRVLERDQHRCQIPGCRHTHDLDVHHIRPRAEGGTNTIENLITLCGAHHRAIHAGRLHLSAKLPNAPSVTHADGTTYGGPVSAPDADLAERVFRGLRWLGFKESDARRAVARALAECDQPEADPAKGELTAEALLKRALAHMPSGKSSTPTVQAARVA